MNTLDKIFFLMKTHNCDNQELASALGLNRQAVTAWKAGRSKSYKKYLYQIADFFGVSVKELSDENIALKVTTDDNNSERTNNSANAVESPEKDKLSSLLETLSPDQLRQVADYVDFILSKRK